MVGATSGASSASTAAMIPSPQIFQHHQPSTMEKHSRSHSPSRDYPSRTPSPLSDSSRVNSSDEHESDYEYDYDYESEQDSRRQRPPGPHLVIDSDADTMRLPSGRIVSSRSGTGFSTLSHMRRRQQQQRRRSSHLVETEGQEQEQDGYSQSEPASHTPSPTPDYTTTTTPPSRRSTHHPRRRSQNAQPSATTTAAPQRASSSNCVPATSTPSLSYPLPNSGLYSRRRGVRSRARSVRPRGSRARWTGWVTSKCRSGS
ncbi:hypothetical protein MN608_11511 [Microdochium nivale]|nr:hypothetical protein MN608_11511 [Microdochium nivale]